MRLVAFICPLIPSIFFLSRPSDAMPLHAYIPHGKDLSFTHGPGETQIANISTRPGIMGHYYMQTVDDLSSDIKVYNEYGEDVYTISSNDRSGHKVEHGFQVLNSHGAVLLQAEDTRKALCGFGYTYHPRNAGVSYGIETKGTNSDQWKMTIRGTQPVSLIYHRGKSENVGAITLLDKDVASITMCKPDQDVPWQVKVYGKQTDLFNINVDTPNYPVEYFIGLVVMVAKRMVRCAP